MEKNIIENKLFYLMKNYSLDESINMIYEEYYGDNPFEFAKSEILKMANINEYDYYLGGVNKNLVKFVTNEIFPLYAKNDQGHGILHIKEVIRRSFALNSTFNLNLDQNMIFAIASCHDLGKYIDHKQHHMIAGQMFFEHLKFQKYFSDQQRQIIREAIEDHRSSKEDEPRSIYGKLISSADRNTTIRIVFIRSFYVALERTPEMKIDEYLDFTIDRLRKKYDETNPENMFFEDKIYERFLKDMRDLLSKPNEFKNLYCEINNINDRTLTVEQAHQKRAVELQNK